MDTTSTSTSIRSMDVAVDVVSIAQDPYIQLGVDTPDNNNKTPNDTLHIQEAEKGGVAVIRLNYESAAVDVDRNEEDNVPLVPQSQPQPSALSTLTISTPPNNSVHDRHDGNDEQPNSSPSETPLKHINNSSSIPSHCIINNIEEEAMPKKEQRMKEQQQQQQHNQHKQHDSILVDHHHHHHHQQQSPTSVLVQEEVQSVEDETLTMTVEDVEEPTLHSIDSQEANVNVNVTDDDDDLFPRQALSEFHDNAFPPLPLPPHPTQSNTQEAGFDTFPSYEFTSSPKPTTNNNTKTPDTSSTSTTNNKSYNHHTKNQETFLNRFQINIHQDPLYLSTTQVQIHAYDIQTQTPILLKLLKDTNLVRAELEGRTNLDEEYIVPIYNALVDENVVRVMKKPFNGLIDLEQVCGLAKEMNRLVSTLVHNTCELGLDESNDNQSGNEKEKEYYFPYVLCCEAHSTSLEHVLQSNILVSSAVTRKVIRDVVVGLILIHTEQRIHGNICPRNIVRVGDKWKLTDLSCSKRIGSIDSTDTMDMLDTTSNGNSETTLDLDKDGLNMAYAPPEVATKVMNTKANPSNNTGGGPHLNDPSLVRTEWDVWSLGCVMYYCLFQKPLWNSNGCGDISEEEMTKLACWSPHIFLKLAYTFFPPEDRSDEDRAAIDLISKLLMPTAGGRKDNFEFGVVSIHQHEFLENHPLESESLVQFGERCAVMLRSENEHAKYKELTSSLSLEEQWELDRCRDVLLLGLFEATDMPTPTSFVVLTRKLSLEGNETKVDCFRRLNEAIQWLELFDDLGPCVKGALDGCVTAVGQFWAKLKNHFALQEYVYLYFIDDLTGEPVVDSHRYPLEIKARSDLLPKMIPLLQLTMRSMSMYHGLSGLARMFGCPQAHVHLSDDERNKAQRLINTLKDERSHSPFGILRDDVLSLRSNKEQYLKGDSIRCLSLRIFVRFLRKKLDGIYFGIRRLEDEKGRSLWTAMSSPTEVKNAVQNRATERLMEEKNLWNDARNERIRLLEEYLELEKFKLRKAEQNLALMKEDAMNSKVKSTVLESSLNETRKRLEETTNALEKKEKEKNKVNLLWATKKKSSSKKKKTEGRYLSQTSLIPEDGSI